MEKVYCGLSQHDRLWGEVPAPASVSPSFFSRSLEDPPFRCPRCCGTLGRDEGNLSALRLEAPSLGR